MWVHRIIFGVFLLLNKLPTTSSHRRLRASLGLKPLEVGGSKAAEEQRAGAERRKQESDAAAAQALAERIARSKERRRQQATLEATQKLSAPDEEVDDALAWIERSRRLAAQSKAPARASARAAEGDGEHTGADLAGFKVFWVGRSDSA